MTERRYDYVIVGAGSTGCVLAARLSEKSDRTVLVLEAGRDFPGVSSLPAAFSSGAFRAFEYPDYVWHYTGVAPPIQADPYDVIRGKVLGGSGTINGANFLRSVPEDFDAWGSELWTFAAVLAFFRRLETDLDFGGELHGTDGPIPVGRIPREQWGAFHEYFYDSALEAGFAEKPDLSDADGSGVGPLPRNDVGGIRMNSALAYLNPARSRLNLTIQPEARVLRILFDRGRATHVEVAIDGQVEEIAAGEILLSAGAVESPHILMVSGIGPAVDLEKLGIRVEADLPVGQNLTDHGTAHIEYVAADGNGSQNVLTQAVGLTYRAPDSPYRNDIRVQSTVGAPLQASGSSASRQTVSVNCILDRPTTVGELTLRSADPTVPPIIDYRYLTAEIDLHRMREAIRAGVQMIERKGFERVVAGRVTPLDSDLAIGRTARRVVDEGLPHRLPHLRDCQARRRG